MEAASRKNAACGYEEAEHTALNDRGLGSDERERLLRTNKKISSVFGTAPPSTFLQMSDRETQLASFSRSDGAGEGASERLSDMTDCLNESTGAEECAASLASSCVPPLDLRRKQHRKSRSMAGLSFYYVEQGGFLPSPHDRPGPSRPNGLMRSQSHTAASRSGSGIRPRPLPPLPRQVVEPEPRLSTDSVSTYSHCSTPRRLPTPPLLPVEADKLEFPRYEETHTANPWPLDVPEDVSSNHLSFSTLPSAVAISEIVFSHEPSSPITSGSSSTTDASSIRSPVKTPKVKPPIPPRPSRQHASPYKFVGNSYSTTSLSSQVSVPPVPPPAEIRKRNRDKMAKLMRILGDSPPPHMVFGNVQDQILDGRISEIEPAIYEESDMGHSTMSHQSISKAKDGYVYVSKGEQERGKGKSSPITHIIEFGSRGRSKSPAATRQPNRLRSRPKREDNSPPARRAISMHVDVVSSSKRNFKVKTKLGSADVTEGVEVANIDAPGIPTRERVPSKQWLLEIGPNKREVQTYDSVVKSLRML